MRSIPAATCKDALGRKASRTNTGICTEKPQLLGFRKWRKYTTSGKPSNRAAKILLLRGFGFWQRRMVRWGRRSNINHFTRAGIVQLLACLFFDHFRIVLKGIDFLTGRVIRLLQSIHLFLKVLILRLLLAIYDHPVSAKHDVDEQPNSEQGDSPGRNATTNPIKHGERRAKPFHGAVGPGFSIGSPLHQCAQLLFRLWEGSDSAALYSKIHCSAAELNF